MGPNSIALARQRPGRRQFARFQADATWAPHGGGGAGLSCDGEFVADPRWRGWSGPCAAFIPDVSLLGRYQRVDGDQPLSFSETGWLVGLTLRWTPFAGFGQAGKLDEARAREQEARAELTDLRREAGVEARSAHAQWQAQVAGWDQAEAAVADAAEALDQTFGRYAEGLDDITDLLRAQAEDLAARTREINARFNALIAAERYRLAISAGSATEIQP